MSSTEEKHLRFRTDQQRENERRRIIGLLKRNAPNDRSVGCFLCGWITEDFEKNGMLTDWPFDLNGKSQFPVHGKIAHIRLEYRSLLFHEAVLE